MTLYASFPYYIPEFKDRWYFYDLHAMPTLVIDGTDSCEGASSVGTQIGIYSDMLNERLAMASPLAITVDLARNQDLVAAAVEITVDQTVTATNNEVLFFVCEDGCSGQSNLLRATLPSEPFTLTDIGQSVTVERSFNLDPTWNEGVLRLVAIVQSMDSREILQTAAQAIDYSAMLTIDCTPDAAEASWLLQGPGGLELTGRGDRSVNWTEAGEFTLTWHDMPTWTPPSPAVQVQVCPEFGSIAFTGLYTGGPFTAVTSGPLGDEGIGVSAGLVDFDNDGDLDIHVVNYSGMQMLRNDGPTDWVDVASSQVASMAAGQQAAWADFDEDGNLDFYLARFRNPNILWMGRGDGSFEPSSAVLPSDPPLSYGASWADFDLDQDLDLYLVNYLDTDHLLENLSELGTKPVEFVVASPDSFNYGKNQTASWTDIDLDGRLDLFVSFFVQPNRMYLNTPDGLVDVTETTGLGSSSTNLGAAWGDYDNDGDFDLYLVASKRADCLYRNDGDLQFTLVEGPYLGDTGASKGAVWADFNNDTWLDLYVTRSNEYDLVLFGDGAGGFDRVGVGVEEAGPGTGPVARGDVDGDGKSDLFLTRNYAANALLYNTAPAGNHWLQVKLTGVEDNLCGIGARVVVTTGATVQQRLITSGSGYMCMHSLSADFGLGAATTVDHLRVHWPNGYVQTLDGLAVDQVVEVTQEFDIPKPTQPVAANWLGQAWPNPFNPRTCIEFSLVHGGPTRLDVFGLDGSLVKSLINKMLPAGPHAVVWDGTDGDGRPAASGTYLYRLIPGGAAQRTGRVVLVR